MSSILSNEITKSPPFLSSSPPLSHPLSARTPSSSLSSSPSPSRLSSSSSSIPPPLSRIRSVSSPSFSPSSIPSSPSSSSSPLFSSPFPPANVITSPSFLSSSRPDTPNSMSSLPSSPSLSPSSPSFSPFSPSNSSRPSSPLSRPRTPTRRASNPAANNNNNNNNKEGRMGYKMSKCNCKLVRSILETRGMHREDKESTEWAFMWNSGHVKHHLLQSMREHQKINHFPGSSEITRKDRLHYNMNEMIAKFGGDMFNFIPPTFILPEQQEAFLAYNLEEKERKKNKNNKEWHEAGETGPWIAKPIASSRGRGIFVFDNIKEIEKTKDSPLLVSHYIPNPFLINGLKFDLRLYVLVTSYDPLRIYIHQEGLGRFATEKYVKSSKSLSDKFMHITNYSVNKTNSNFIQNEDADIDNVGSKWSLSAVKEHLMSGGVDVIKIMESIRSIIVKTIMSVQPFISAKFNEQVPFRHNCFELYGFDILLDENLTPWLLEVNLSPSLSTDSPLDLRIKSAVINDLLNMVGVFNAQPTTSFPTNEKLPFSEGGQSTQSPYLDFVSDEFSFRGGFEMIFPARDWESYLPFLEKNENTRLYPAIVERLFGGLRRPRAPKVKPQSLRTHSFSAFPSTFFQKEKLKEKERLKEKEKEKDKLKEKEKPKEKEKARERPKLRERESSSQHLLNKSTSNLLTVSPPSLKRGLSKTLPSPSLSPSLSVSTHSKSTPKSPLSSPSPTIPSTSNPFPSLSSSSTSPTTPPSISPTLLRSFKNMNLNLPSDMSDYTTPLGPATYSPFKVAPRDIFGNIVTSPSNVESVGEKQNNTKPKTPPPPLNPHNETLLKILETKLEEETNKSNRSYFQDIKLQPIHAREIFTAYLQRLAARLSSLSQKTIYDQFYSSSSHLDFQKFNFSEISDNIQLVHMVEKFLLKTSNNFNPPSPSLSTSSSSSSSSPAVSRKSTPLARSTTPAGLTRDNTNNNINNMNNKPVLRRSMSSGKKEDFPTLLLSQKAGQVLRTLEAYITSYKLQTNSLKKRHPFNSNEEKETEWVEWERFAQHLNGYSDKDLESLISRFGEGENHIYLPL